MVAVGAVAVGGAAAQSAPTEGEYSSILDNMDGDGSASDPYQVTNITQLQAIDGEGVTTNGSTFEVHIELQNDIDADQTSEWTGGFNSLNFDESPAGNSSVSINFDGNGYAINDYYSEENGVFNLSVSHHRYPDTGTIYYTNELNIDVGNVTFNSPTINNTDSSRVSVLMGKSSYVDYFVNMNSQYSSFQDIDINDANITANQFGAVATSVPNTTNVEDISVSGNFDVEGGSAGVFRMHSNVHSEIDGMKSVTMGGSIQFSGGTDPVAGIADTVIREGEDIEVSAEIVGTDSIFGITSRELHNSSNILVSGEIDSTAEGVGISRSLHNSSDITVRGHVEGGSYSAGVVGEDVIEYSSDILVSGDIGNPDDSINQAGGLIAFTGEVRNSSDITVTGDIYGDDAAGIGGTKVENVEDILITGDIESSGRAGGLTTDRDVSGVSDVKIESNITGQYNAGGVISGNGDLQDSENITFIGSVEIYNSDDAGGLVGRGSITNISDIEIEATVSGSDIEIGGLVGTGDITDSEGIEGDISVASYMQEPEELGGISGDGEVVLSNSSFDIEIITTSALYREIGGISGDDDVTVDNSYFNITWNTAGAVWRDNNNDVGGIAPDSNVDLDDSLIKLQLDDKVKYSLAETGSVDNSIVLIEGQDPTFSISGGSITDSYSTFPFGPYEQFSEDETKYYNQEEKMSNLNFSSWEESNGAYPIVSQAPVGPQSTGLVQAQIESVEIDENVTASEDTEVAVEFDPDSIGPVDNHELQIIQDGEVLASGEIEDETEYLTWDSTDQTGGQNLTVETGDQSQDFTVNVVAAGGGEDTLFSSFDIPGTDISVPLLPVGAVLVIGALGVGYIYYREEEVDFQ